MEAPDFWDDAEKASADMKELKDLKSIVERADALSMAYDDIMTLIEMGNEEAPWPTIPGKGWWTFLKDRKTWKTR